MRALFSGLAALTGFAVAACSSYETTFFGFDENGAQVTRTVPGVPIVVTVPQKLGFVATESTFLLETKIVDDATGKVTVARRESVETTVDKTPIPLGQSQLVSLDIKRPFYGTAKTKMTLANQYPTDVSSEVDDKTLDRVLTSIDKFIEKQGEPTGNASATTTKTLLRQRTYMVVYDPVTQTIGRAPM